VAPAAGAGRGGRADGLSLRLGLREVCAVAYVLMLEELYRQIAVHTQAALFARAMGNDVDVPDPYAARARFDELLRADPDTTPSSRRGVLLEAFGLSGG
jgi:hypothetical protein